MEPRHGTSRLWLGKLQRWPGTNLDAGGPLHRHVRAIVGEDQLDLGRTVIVGGLAGWGNWVMWAARMASLGEEM